MWKLVLKLIWVGLGSFGIYSLAKPYLPQQGLIKGIQGSLVSVQNLDSQTPAQIPQIIKTEATKILETATAELKQFPAKQVQKIKIGACEGLLETDICAIAKELKCQ